MRHAEELRCEMRPRVCVRVCRVNTTAATPPLSDANKNKTNKKRTFPKLNFTILRVNFC